jgi:hypothetical protein
MTLTTPGSLSDQIFGESDVDAVFNFELARLAEVIPDETERQFAVWHSSWRREFLEHYARTGWSFIVRDDNGSIRGFSLGQMVLFYHGHTQVLWLEYIGADDPEIASRLVEVTYRWARDKHLQGVHLRRDISLYWPLALQEWQAQQLPGGDYVIRTTKG